MTNSWSLPDTARSVAPGYTRSDAATSTAKITVSFWLAAHRGEVKKEALKTMKQPLKDRHYLDSTALESQFGADPIAVKAVRDFARKHGLDFVEGKRSDRHITMEVPADKVEELFGVQLATYSNGQQSYRGREGYVALPADDFPDQNVRSQILGVFGLDNRPQARRFSSPLATAPADLTTTDAGLLAGVVSPPVATASVAASGSGAGAAPVPPTAVNPASYPPLAYGFPSNSPGARVPAGPAGKGLTGSKQSVGVIGFGGTIEQARFTQFVAADKIKVHPPQQITQQDSGFTQETLMDVQIIRSCAPDAHITVYAFDETEHGWISGLSEILKAPSVPSVLSISWGWPEIGGDTSVNLWTTAAIKAVEDLLAALTLRGVSVVVSSGDAGPLIHYPASSAFVMSCGGTQTPTATQEAVWNGGNIASGGGISTVIDKPDWQSDIRCTGPDGNQVPADKRCIPDVAAWALYSSPIVQANQGTSASAPQWAGLFALANQESENKLKKPVGNINVQLYDPGTGLQAALNDIKQGNNSIGSPAFFKASDKWDACTGWGSPHVIPFVQALVGKDAVQPGEPAGAPSPSPIPPPDTSPSPTAPAVQ